MTHDEMIAVIQAHKEGKEIEYWDTTYKQGGWWPISSLGTNPWNFERYDYRIKPKPHYRPFKSAEEVVKALNGHGWVVNWDMGKDMQICVCDKYVLIPDYEGRLTTFGFPMAFECLTFTDGTPFGVKED